MLQESAIGDGVIEAIRNCSLELLDSEEPATKRVFIKTYMEPSEAKGDSLTICFSFKEPPTSSQNVVAAVGFEGDERREDSISS